MAGVRTRAATTALGLDAAFGAWSLLVWGTRIDNIWSDAGLGTGAQVGRTALALSFVVPAVVLLAWTWRCRRSGLPPRTRYLLGPFAGWTVGVWVVRATSIVLADHGAAFKVVHTALAAVSIALAVAAWRALRARGGGAHAAPPAQPVPTSP